MYSYYVVYGRRDREQAAGVFVMDVGPGDALLWDHKLKAWSYNPALVVGFLDDDRNDDRWASVDRAEAERIALGVTGGEELPDEETIGWIFRWRGRPRQGG
ncbi:hypothetical protein O7635_03555 [Asanoa sp. WMMD1127]|uniref:hypothetical protein n=1 Tax=Asanoa sp. WMMD1127 TaxID=3016107 RepID=UPI0024165047|nr:hypothetical protein [Asanoa sp. WMMD1127]MDG4820928.1 hypothetical protein [Asanoa sp. WMMD1127]